MERTPKIINISKLICAKAKLGDFLILPHAIERQAQRSISVPDIIYVLLNGWHEVKKDEYKPEFNSWNYSIRGKTVDARSLRVAVTFDENNMLIITVIDLNK